MFQKQIPVIIAIGALLCYLQLLEFVAIPNAIRVGSRFIAPFIVVVYLIIKIVYEPIKTGERRMYAIPIFVLILSSLISFIPAKFIHHQNLVASFWANRLIYYFFLYYFLHEFQVKEEYLEKSMIAIGLLTVLFYYLQVSVYPTLFFDIKVMEDRNTLRIFLPGMLCSTVSYFYFMNKAFMDRKWIYLLLCLALLSIFVLQATRQLIFSFILLTIIYVLNSREVKNKIIIVILILGLITSSIFVFEDIIVQMLQLSVRQAETAGSNVRVRAAEFFLTRGMHEPVNYVLGNGVPNNLSSYGRYISFLSVRNGFFLSDIGIIGDYYKYGIFFVISVFVIYVIALKQKVQPRHSYWKYYILMQILTMFTAKGYFGYADIHLIMGLYILDISSGKSKNIDSETSKTNTQFLS